MKRFKLSRKEKLLYATPLLLPLLVWAWPLVKEDSLERTLQKLAGPEAVDCGNNPRRFVYQDPCAIAAFKAGKPFIIRNIPSGYPESEGWGMVRTPEGQIYSLQYYRQPWAKASLSQTLCVNPRVSATTTRKTPFIIWDGVESPPATITTITTYVWH